jgi:hypothetical protein
MNTVVKTPLEWFSFLNALLVQFSKLNSFGYSLLHDNFKSAKGTVYVNLWHEPYIRLEPDILIEIDLNLPEQQLQREFESARNRIVCFTKLSDKAKAT